jgi:hypothetical protein
METPKQKANELVDKFYQAQVKILANHGTAPLDSVEYEIAKQSALIDIQNSIDLLKHIDENEAYNVEWYIKELNEIKTEIEKL